MAGKPPPSLEIIEFDGLSKEDQAQIEDKIIMFITNPTTKQSHQSRCSPYLSSPNINKLQWLQLNSWNGSIIYRHENFSTPNRMTAFDRLPRNIELLLGVIHRKFFEEYKKAVQDENIDKE